MPNRQEIQNKGQGYHKNSDGKSVGPGTSHKGIARVIRANKHTEAEERNRNSAPDKRRSFWRERGFRRQSEANRLVAGTVAEINDLAREHKQRSADWPMIDSEITETMINRA